MELQYNFIEGTNTQTRNLFLALNILKIIGNRNISIEIVKIESFNWNKQQSLISEWYKTQKGQLTNKSFNYYTKLLLQIGLISKLGTVVRPTRMGLLYLSLVKQSDKVSEQLMDWEKLFILYILLREDSDGIICILDLIDENKEGLSDINIRTKFNSALLLRLQHKKSHLSLIDRLSLDNKIIELMAKFISDKHINKHVVPVRLAWLMDLGILMKKKYNSYVFTLAGKESYNFFYKFKENDVCWSDINNKWLDKQGVKKSLLLFNASFSLFSLETSLHRHLLEKHLLIFYKQNSSDGAFRLNSETTLLYLSIIFFQLYSICIEISELKSILNKGITVERFFFVRKESERTNETYINIRLS